MDSRDLLLRDVFDRLPGDVEIGDGDPIDHPVVSHALVFWKVWQGVMGTPPSSCEHCDYCDYAVDVGQFSESKFKSFMQNRRRINTPPLTNMREYAKRLEDRGYRLRELKTKIAERYDKWVDEEDLAAFHAAVSAGRDRGFADLLVRNPCTMHTMAEVVSPKVTEFHKGVTRRDALRYCFSRDYMFNSYASTARCVLVGSEPSCQPEELSMILEAASEASNVPIVIINCPFDADTFDFYHRRVLIQSKDEYDAVPRNFYRFVLVDKKKRPSMCRVPGGSLWLTDDEGAEGELDGQAGGKDYVIVSARPGSGLGSLFVPHYEPALGYLGCEGVVKWAWKRIFTTRLPNYTRNPKDGVLLHEQYMLRRACLDRSWEAYRAPAQSPESKGVVVMVDNREDVGSALAVLTALCNLEPGWSILVFCTPTTLDYYQGVFSDLGAEFVTTSNLPTKNFNIECYNIFMKRPSTWAQMRCRRALLVQSDGTLVRRGLCDHPAYRSAYAGAPWKSHPYLEAVTKNRLVGNGGFSIRDPRECQRVAESYPSMTLYPMAPAMTQAEDVFFSCYIGDVCKSEDAMTFSMEQVFVMDCLGYHQFWNYHPVESTARFFERLASEIVPVEYPVQL